MTELPDPDLDAFAEVLRTQWQAADGMGAPRRVGRYRLERELGRGGQGAVYLAEDQALHRRVAVKLLTGVQLSSPDSLARFHREAQLASKLDHPGLCTVFDSGMHGRNPFIAMRYVEGQSLEQRIAAARDAGRTCIVVGTDPDSGADSTRAVRERLFRVLGLIEEVARAVHVAHQSGVVHRDLKPANIVITAEGRPVVLDFGIAGDLAGDLATLTRPGEVFGTPAYMAVEQVRGMPGATDPRTDVWALGVVLYECVTLTRPFEAATREALFAAIRETDPPDPRVRVPGLPRDLAVVLATALEKDLGRRYASALDFAEDLRRLRTFQPIRARPAGAWLRTCRWAQRNRALAAVMTTVPALLLIGLIWTLQLLDITASERDQKTQALAEVGRLAGLKHVRDLVAWDERLWPTWPGLVAGPHGMDAWIARAERLYRSLHEHESTRRALLARASAGADAASPTFADDLDAFRFEALRELIDALSALPAQIAAMRSRREAALAIDRITLVEAADAWTAARAAIRAEPRYSGLDLRPIRGLVPLGADPRSGLQEFGHAQSGRVPVRRLEGDLELAEDTAAVLVLLPGGSFVLGASTDASSPHYDPLASEDEGPPHEVGLAPFFLAKHELTQAQWVRIMGSNPSGLPAGRTERGTTFTGLHPVEQVSWRDAMEAARRMGLTLPTEAQWEYACRAGTRTFFATGDDVLSLRGYANILDEGSGKIAPGGRDPEPRFDDGFIYHAPVGTYAANAFGLHDMHGNLWEMCRDYYENRYRSAVRAGDGYRLVPEALRQQIVVRSSSFDYGGRLARCALRNNSMPDHRYYTQGFRVSRDLGTDERQ